MKKCIKQKCKKDALSNSNYCEEHQPNQGTLDFSENFREKQDGSKFNNKNS